MSNLIHNELLNVERLMYQAKFEESLDNITDFEKLQNITPTDQLLSLIYKGKIFCYQERYKEAVEIGEKAYELSQKYGGISLCID
ncbi:MAG: hypothetical protein ACFFE5_10170, partial [Candidatus Thorarchaeota archaeon]